MSARLTLSALTRKKWSENLTPWYRAGMFLAAATWLWISYWNAWWLKPWVWVAAVFFLLTARWPEKSWTRKYGVMLATLSGLLQVLDGTVWHEHPTLARPGLLPGLYLLALVVTLQAFGYVPVAAEREVALLKARDAREL